MVRLIFNRNSETFRKEGYLGTNFYKILTSYLLKSHRFSWTTTIQCTLENSARRDKTYFAINHQSRIHIVKGNVVDNVDVAVAPGFNQTTLQHVQIFG